MSYPLDHGTTERSQRDSNPHYSSYARTRSIRFHAAQISFEQTSSASSPYSALSVELPRCVYRGKGSNLHLLLRVGQLGLGLQLLLKVNSTRRRRFCQRARGGIRTRIDPVTEAPLRRRAGYSGWREPRPGRKEFIPLRRLKDDPASMGRAPRGSTGNRTRVKRFAGACLSHSAILPWLFFLGGLPHVCVLTAMGAFHPGALRVLAVRLYLRAAAVYTEVRDGLHVSPSLPVALLTVTVRDRVAIIPAMYSPAWQPHAYPFEVV